MVVPSLEGPAALRRIGDDERQHIGDDASDKRRQAGGNQGPRQDEEQQGRANADHGEPDKPYRDEPMRKPAHLSAGAESPGRLGWPAFRRFTGISRTPSRNAEKNAWNEMTIRLRPST